MGNRGILKANILENMGQLKNAQENREFIPLAHGAWVPFPLRKHDLISINHLIHREFFQLLEKRVPPLWKIFP